MEKTYKVFCYKKQGKQRNQFKDVEYALISGKRQIYALSDGISSKKYSVTGAQQIQNVLADFLSQVPDEMFQSDEMIKRQSVKLIETTINELSQNKQCDKNEFASTLMMLSVPKNNDYFRWIHIGDGVIFRTDQEKVRIISYPLNGITPRYKYVTTSMPMERYFRTGIAILPEGIGMMTDGISKLFFPKRIVTPLADRAFVHEGENLEQILNTYHGDDDQSLLWIRYY